MTLVATVEKKSRSGKKNELRKAVEAVHSTSDLTFVANKLLNVFVHNALSTIETEETFRMTIVDAARGAGFNSKNTKFLKDAARELREKTIEWDTFGKDGSWGITSFISEVVFTNGVIEYSMPPTVRKLFSLVDGRLWALVNLDFAAEFSGNTTLKLYENCVRFRGIGSTGQRTVIAWRKALQLTTPTYDEFRYFRRAIEKAIKEVNEKTDIEIIPDYIREGRVVVAICFYVKSSTVSLSRFVDPELMRRICALGVTDRTARKYIREHEADYLEGNLSVVEQRYKAGVVKSPAPYLKKALEEDFRVVKTEVEIAREAEQEKKAVDVAAAAASEKAAREKRQARKDEAEKVFQSLAEDEQDELIAEFFDFAKDSNKLLYTQLKKTGVAGSALAAKAFNDWLADRFRL